MERVVMHVESSTESSCFLAPPPPSSQVALAKLLAHLDLPSSALMAVGDGGNDLEMIRVAGWGVAMGNATGAVSAAADVCVASNDEDGVAEALERFVL
jgi:hydroxymethylpyrimidine pyrophosphatase-like HAD family hydrolase